MAASMQFGYFSMFSSPVSAAWHASMSQEGSDAGLCVALGEPERVFSTDCPSEVPGLLFAAHEHAKSGFYLVGGLSYEAASALNPHLRTRNAGEFPLLHFQAYAPEQIKQITLADLALVVCPGGAFQPWTDELPLGAFLNTFAAVRQAIEDGEFYQINLTTRLRSQGCLLDCWALFQRLYAAQPAGQSLFLRAPAFDVLSLSPELFFKWDGSLLETAPMKGTRRPDEAGFDLLSDSDKDRAENVMIVDLLRNDMAKVCAPRSVQVRSLFDVMHLPTVEQMTSSIVGRTLPSLSLPDLFTALFPCGSVTGAPKAQSMMRIAQWELSPRNFYCGALGVMAPTGRVHFNVPIRTVLRTPSQALEYGVGSGITWYSTAGDEKKEWWQKTEFLRQSTADFDLIETLRLEHGQFVALDLHLERMARSANELSYLWDEQAVLATLRVHAADHSSGVHRVRLQLGAQGELAIQTEVFEFTAAPVSLRLADRDIAQAGEHRPTFWLNKTTHRHHYDFFFQQARGCFDVLLYAPGQWLTESCRCNVVLSIDGGLYTPTLNSDGGVNFLPGVLRSVLLRENTIRQAALNVRDLRRADQVWLINSLRGWVPVAEILDEQDQVVFSMNQNNKG